MVKRTVAPVVHKYRIEEQPSDKAYWQSLSPVERVAALEEIRAEYHRWKYHAEPRLQRVCSIVKR